jgi:hypothetical protein
VNITGASILLRGQTLYVRGWAADTVTAAPVTSVTISIDGSSVGTATLGISRPDVATFYNRPDYTNSGWSFQMSTSSLSLAVHTVAATATGPSGTAQVGGTKSITINALPGGGQEIGSLDVAGDSNGSPTVLTTGTLVVRGWAADTATGAPVTSVTVLVDGVSAGLAVLGGSRQDVANYFGRSDYVASGWTLLTAVAGFSLGTHTVTAMSVGPSGSAQLPGTNTITISTQAGAGQEIGSLDAAGDSAGNPTVFRGAQLFVRGWAADTVTGAPVTTVRIFVDGTSVGTATLGLTRNDVATFYGRSDYTNCGYTFQTSTSAMSTGPHTVTAIGVGPSGSAQLPGTKTATIQ